MSHRHTPSFETELRVSLNPLKLLLPVSASILSATAYFLPNPPEAMNIALLLFLISGMIWLLERWAPHMSRWFFVIAVSSIIYIVHHWLRVPGLLFFLAFPTVLAAMLLGTKAATATAVGQTMLVILVSGPLAMISGTGEVVTALVAIWLMAIGIHILYHPVKQLARWSWDNYERARDLLEEARNHQAELKEVLKAQAYASRELALTGERLAAMRLIAEEARKAKAEFVANVSHEFRTPLNIIIGLAEILLDAPETYGENLSPNVQRDLGILYRNCEHLASMINDVLDLSQVEAGRLALRREWVHPQALIDSASIVVQPLLDEKNLHLRLSVPDNLPQIHCDPARIRQVILNLVSNAARFTEKGGVTMGIQVQEPYMVFSVTDTGPGIAPEHLERIFEPFEQALAKYGQSKTGSGLGLSISKQFVELHEGRMWVESKLGSGSSFYFKLPVKPLAGPTAPPHRWITEGWVKRISRANIPASRLDQRMILCDDTGELYPIFSRYADDIEFIDTRDLHQLAQSLDEFAAQAILVNAASPDALWPLIEETNRRIPDMPVIGCSVPSRFAKALAAGAMDYIMKPVRRTDLRQALASVGKPVKRVLVVDDEKETLWLIRRMLHALDSDLDITTALSGTEALAQLRDAPPDLMFLDIVMPSMSGWQVLAAKAHDEAISGIPVIVLSAQDPRHRPLTSQIVVAAMGEGLSISKLLRCSRALAALLLSPDREPDPEPV